MKEGYNLEILKTIAIDVTESVFENESAAMMYITKDIYSDSFIVAIPVESFAYQVWENGIERDLADLQNSTNFGDVSKTERLVTAIREGIAQII